MGYRRPSYLARLERIDTDSRTLRSLEQVIPQGEPYFSDYF
ncbi:sterol carrier protein domain-containing protein [Lactiplantibacillus plantarum]